MGDGCITSINLGRIKRDWRAPEEVAKGSGLSSYFISPPGQGGGAWEGFFFRNLSSRTGSQVCKLKEEKFGLTLERNSLQ